MPVFVVVMFFLKFYENFVLVECGRLKSSFFSYGHDSKLLRVIHNLWPIIDGVILRTPLNAF